MLAASTLIMVGSAFAQTIPKPSVPEFTVKLVAHPYDVPSTTTMDPYTGASTTYPGYVEENSSIEVTIENQPFTAYKMADGNWSRLYYNLRYKGHFSFDWTYYPPSPESGYLNSSNSDYTVISLPKYPSLANLPAGSQIDFQVQALIGYDETRYAVSGNTGELLSYGNYFTGESSDWSNTQTITISESQAPTPSPATTPTPTTTPYQEPQQTEQEIIIGVAIAVAGLGAGLGLLVYLIKRK